MRLLPLVIGLGNISNLATFLALEETIFPVELINLEDSFVIVTASIVNVSSCTLVAVEADIGGFSIGMLLNLQLSTLFGELDFAGSQDNSTLVKQVINQREESRDDVLLFVDFVLSMQVYVELLDRAVSESLPEAV